MKTFLITSILSVFASTLSAQTYKGSSAVNSSEKLNEQYCTGLFKSAEGTVLDVLNDPSAITYINILDWLNGRVAGLRVYTAGNGERVPIIRGMAARLFLNEMQVDAATINAIPSAEIAMIKVIRAPFAGAYGNGAAVAIYTIQAEEETD